jgi:ABC-type glycerol-3-phosphate transport system substrate-binding protein
VIAIPPVVLRTLLVIAIVVGVLVDGFFAIVNFYPVAPHRSRGPKRYVVMQLDEVQAAWFQANILDDFNAEADANLEVLRVTDEEQLQAATADGAKHGKDVVLAALPVTQIGHAIETKLVRPFTDVVSARRITDDFGDLDDSVLAAGKVNGTQYFLPRMAVIDVAVYRVSKVRDAVLHWSVLRPQINAALKQINGRGLPDKYELGLSPGSWNAYDLFVMGYYWAHRSYGGEPARPRVAHRTGDEIDGQRDIVSAIYRMGATDATIGTFDSRPAVDYFQWEALFRGEGLYDPAMYGDEPFDDEAVIDGLEKGELFFAPIDAMEAFNLHGGAHANARAHVADPADLEFTSMPQGASLALDDAGHPTRSRPSFSFREDWVWALPAAAHATDVSYKLVQFLWRPEIHARECEAIGMLPLHPQVVAERVSRFRLDWMSHVFEAGLEQARHGEPTPMAMIASGQGSVYAQLWTKIVGGKLPAVPDAPILDTLHAPPKPKPLAVVAVDQPSHPDEPAATAAKPDEPPPPPAENEDWETDVVLQNVGSAAGSGARP